MSIECRYEQPNPIFALICLGVCVVIFIIGCIKMDKDESNKIGYFVGGLLGSIVCSVWGIIVFRRAKEYVDKCIWGKK